MSDAKENTNVESTLLICMKCNVGLEKSVTKFSYLNHNFSTQLLKCPICGQVYIPEDLVNGKMGEVEKMLEEK